VRSKIGCPLGSNPVVFNTVINELLITRKKVANIILFDKQIFFKEKKFVTLILAAWCANMTSKTQNCCDKFIIHKKMKNFLILHKKAS
jgi:hypothetical protein